MSPDADNGRPFGGHRGERDGVYVKAAGMTIQAEADIMGMPVSVRICDGDARLADAEAVFAYLRHIDCAFSTYKPDSETERINRGELCEADSSEEMRAVIALCEQTKAETRGYFDARYGGRFDPSGIVKGYAIRGAADILRQRGFRDFFVEAGGDIQTCGHNERGDKWRVGIRSPFSAADLVKVVRLSGEGIATSGIYVRGEHIYDPVRGRRANDMASVTVIAANVYEADRFATAAFAMGTQGALFIEGVPGLEGYAITWDQRAYYTTGFQRYVSQ